MRTITVKDLALKSLHLALASIRVVFDVSLAIFGLFFSGLVIVVFLAHASFVPEGHKLTMFTFVQPLWTIPIAFLVWSGSFRIQLKVKNFKWAPNNRFFSGLRVCMILVPLFNCLFFEDYNIARRESSRPIPLIFPSLKVMAWNVQYYDFGIHEVLGAIKEHDPDVVFLSEHIVNSKKQQWYDKVAKPYRIYTGSHGDAGILTKLPVIEWEEVILPSRQTNLIGANLLEEQILNHRRSFIRVKVNYEGVPIDLISVRFIAGRAKTEAPWDQIPWGMYLFDTQRREVQFFTDYIKGLGLGPFLFGGDLNAPPSSWTMRKISQVARDTYMDHHWFGDFTFRSKIFRFQKKKNMPMIRLDYIFASPEVITESVRIQKIQLSDHDALIGRYMIPRYLSHRP